MANIRRVPFENPNVRIAEYIFSWPDGRVRKVGPGEVVSLGKSPNMISVVFKRTADQTRTATLLFPDNTGPGEIVEYNIDQVELIGEILRGFPDKIGRDIEISLTNYAHARAFMRIGFVFTRETIINYSKYKKMAARLASDYIVREQSGLPINVRMIRHRRLIN